jgi:hypothetical protein
MTEYEKQKKEKDTKIPVANTILKQPHFYFFLLCLLSKSQSDQKLSHKTRSDLKARL